MNKNPSELNITVKPDCGNAPKKIFLKDFNIAFAKHDIAFILGHITDDIDWRIVRDKHILGKAQMENSITQYQDNTISELNLNSIITHGKEGAVSGTMIMTNGDCYEFCDVYIFDSSKGSRVKAITSYIIKSSS